MGAIKDELTKINRELPTRGRNLWAAPDRNQLVRNPDRSPPRTKLGHAWAGRKSRGALSGPNKDGVATARLPIQLPLDGRASDDDHLRKPKTATKSRRCKFIETLAYLELLAMNILSGSQEASRELFGTHARSRREAPLF